MTLVARYSLSAIRVSVRLQDLLKAESEQVGQLLQPALKIVLTVKNHGT